MCKKGNPIYGEANGVSKAWTLHVYRTEGLPANPQGLFTDDFDKSKEMRRVARAEGLGDHDGRACLFGNVDPNDLTQGSVGNCWLISAFAAAAESPEAVKALCKQQAAMEGNATQGPSKMLA